MANYCGLGRSNYFRVRDIAAFKDALPDDYRVVDGPDGVVTVLCENEDGGWTAYEWGDDESDDADAAEDVEVDVIDLVATHLTPGEVAVFQSIGNEKLRYVNGVAVAINADGDRVTVTLDDIYDLAATTFNTPREQINAAVY